MKSLHRLTLTALAAALGVVSPAMAQQLSPRDMVPPPLQKPPVSDMLTIVGPSAVQTPTANPVSVTPLTASATVPTTPKVPQPGSIETNTVSASGQSLSSGSVQASPWDKLNAVSPSTWGAATATTNSLAPALRTTPDPWKSIAPSPNWDSAPSLGTSGTKTEWK